MVRPRRQQAGQRAQHRQRGDALRIHARLLPQLRCRGYAPRRHLPALLREGQRRGAGAGGPCAAQVPGRDGQRSRAVYERPSRLPLHGRGADAGRDRQRAQRTCGGGALDRPRAHPGLRGRGSGVHLHDARRCRGGDPRRAGCRVRGRGQALVRRPPHARRQICPGAGRRQRAQTRLADRCGRTVEGQQGETE